MSRSFPLVALVATLALSTFGCAATTDDASPPDDGSGETSQDDITSALLTGVASIEVTTRFRARGPSPARVEPGPTITAPARVAKIMKGLGRLVPNAPRPACGTTGPITEMVFRNAAGKPIGDASYQCSVGTLHVIQGDKTVSIFANVNSDWLTP